MARTHGIPEAPYALFALLLHFAWEMLQAPLWVGMAQMPHWQGVKVCTIAAFGDVLIALVAFWLTAAWARSRLWIVTPTAGQVALCVAAGMVLTIGYEALATGPMARWEYAEWQPTLPVLGTGLAPVLQWLLLPPLALWLTNRHLRGASPGGQSQAPRPDGSRP